MRSVIYYYILGVAVSWGAVPIIAILTARMRIFDTVQLFWSVFATISYAILTYLGMHDIGERDRRPYKWVRYKAKGLVMGLMGFAVIYLVEAFLIFIADKYAVVQHPVMDISGLHGYITQFIYMPFFWITKLMDPVPVMPSVNYLTALIPAVFIGGFNGFAYWMGYTDKVIIKKKPHGKWAQVIFYGRRKKKKQTWQDKLNESFYNKDKKRKRDKI